MRQSKRKRRSSKEKGESEGIGDDEKAHPSSAIRADKLQVILISIMGQQKASSDFYQGIEESKAF